jgi:hypothetical protein
MTLDFLERQRDLDDRSTFQLYLIIETMTSLIEDKDLQEIQTTFKNLKLMTTELKTWDFIYEDHDGNELTRKQIDCYDRKDAEKIAFDLQSNSMLNDLALITIKLK